jgi:hypothetical protein
MATVEKQLLGSVATLMTTELNSLASSTTAGAISSVAGTAGVFNNTVGGGGFDGYTIGQLELNLAAPAGTLTANTAANIWFLQNVDGTNYEDGGSSVIPARAPDVVFPVRAVSTAQRINRRALIPEGNWYVLIQHNTGQTWAASANTVKLLPATYEGV